MWREKVDFVKNECKWGEIMTQGSVVVLVEATQCVGEAFSTLDDCFTPFGHHLDVKFEGEFGI